MSLRVPAISGTRQSRTGLLLRQPADRNDNLNKSLMNILVPDSWLREYLETEGSPSDIQRCLSLCGPSVERVNKTGEDFIYEIEITSNRVDMASVYGVAREAAAILPQFGFKTQLKPLEIKPFIEKKEIFPLEVADPDGLCHRLLAIVMTDVQINPSPKYISERLEKSGVRSLNNLIDITNYVMLELGHPCHVFDYDRIKTAKLILRRAKKGEILVTLDNKRCPLDENDVVIDDGTGRIIDLPGIMGTANSVVTGETKRIVFFIESNNPIIIRKTSMKLALRTMAATINEKQPDPQLAKTAILRGIDLYQKNAGAKVAGKLIDIYPKPTSVKTVNTDTDFINKHLGVKLEENKIVNILESLQFTVLKSQSLLKITPPTFRQFDIGIGEDVVEEVARIYGYHNLPSNLMTGAIPISRKAKDFPVEEKIKTILKYWGHTEVYNYSFISKSLIEKAGLEIPTHLKVANPLTNEIEYMRISLIPSILKNISDNQTFKENLRLFEQANTYHPKTDNLPDEKPSLVLTEQSDFLKLKGTVLSLFEELGIKNMVEEIPAVEGGFFHPKQVLLLSIPKTGTVCLMGKIHPFLATGFGLKNDLFLAEIKLDKLIPLVNETKKYTPISLYPAAVEDLTFTICRGKQIGLFIPAIKSLSQLIVKIELIDKYKESYTFRITYQDPSRNLTDEDVKTVREKIIEMAADRFNAKLKS